MTIERTGLVCPPPGSAKLEWHYLTAQPLVPERVTRFQTMIAERSRGSLLAFSPFTNCMQDRCRRMTLAHDLCPGCRGSHPRRAAESYR